MICEKCNAEMEYFVEGYSCGWKCTRCDMEYVTSYCDPIMLDENEYRITIEKTDNPSALQIKLVAEICRCNFINSKEKLLNGFAIEAKSAKDTRSILSKLKNANLGYVVSPDFEYKY